MLETVKYNTRMSLKGAVDWWLRWREMATLGSTTIHFFYSHGEDEFKVYDLPAGKCARVTIELIDDPDAALLATAQTSPATEAA